MYVSLLLGVRPGEERGQACSRRAAFTIPGRVSPLGGRPTTARSGPATSAVATEAISTGGGPPFGVLLAAILMMLPHVSNIACIGSHHRCSSSWSRHLRLSQPQRCLPDQSDRSGSSGTPRCTGSGHWARKQVTHISASVQSSVIRLFNAQKKQGSS